MLITQLELNVVGFDHIKDLYEHDVTFATPFAKCMTHTSWEQYYIKDGYLMRANKLCIPESSLRLLLLQEAHGGGLMGHFGRDKTFATLSKNYFWPKMFRDVSRFTNRCSTCRKAKSHLNPMVYICHFLFHINHGKILAWMLCLDYLGLKMARIPYLLLWTDSLKWLILSHAIR